MSLLVPAKARAYVNYGRWIADCPVECGSALALKPGQSTFHCVECQSISTVEWPKNPDAIWEALQERPVRRNQNWFPKGHVLALKSGCPHGQTPKQLRDETKEHQGA